jgi:hypothetical protein
MKRKNLGTPSQRLLAEVGVPAFTAIAWEVTRIHPAFREERARVVLAARAPKPRSPAEFAAWVDQMLEIARGYDGHSEAARN